MIVSERKYIINSILSLIVVSFVSLAALTFVRKIILSNATENYRVHPLVSPSGLYPEYDNSELCIGKSKFDIEYGGTILTGISNYWNDLKVYNNTTSQANLVLENGVVRVQDVNGSGNKTEIITLGWWGPDGFSEESPAGVGRFSSDAILSSGITSKQFLDRTINDKLESELFFTIVDNTTKQAYKLTVITKGIIQDNSVVFSGKPQYRTDTGVKFDNNIVAVGNKFPGRHIITTPSFTVSMRKPTEDEIKDWNKGDRAKLFRPESKDDKLLSIGIEESILFHDGSRDNLFLLDNIGCIYMVDRETLTLNSAKGKLSDSPANLHSYSITPYNKSSKDRINGRRSFSNTGIHAGLAVFSHHKNGKVTLSVFDADGKEVGRDTEYIFPNQYTIPDWYNRYMLPTEACYGLSFHLLSYLMADAIPANEIMENMLAIPYSYAARSVLVPEYRCEGLNSVLLLCLVDYAICIYLLRLSFKRSGLPGGYFKYWAVLIVILGPMALIAYLLTRPGIKQVTCPNCGQNRRPDQEKCLNCKAPWELPHLEPVGWGIVGQRSCQSARLPEKLAKPFDSVET